MESLHDQILLLFGGSGKASLTRRQIAEKLHLKGREHKLLAGILSQMVKNKLLLEQRGRYRLREKIAGTAEGTFAVTDRGFAFLRHDDPRLEDLFIPARAFGTAMDGDRILVEQRFSPRERRPYAVVLKILRRAHQQLLGSYQTRGTTAQVFPLNPKLGGPIKVAPRPDIASGDVVVIRMDHFAGPERPAEGRVIEILGPGDNPQVDIETVIRNHNLPHRFSAATLNQAESLPNLIATEDLAVRVDLRELTLVTIDGDDARDFDDAVTARKEADGHFKLWVCIADVSHYVTPGSPLDVDARERGASVYFPGFCLPMLPEKLSNGICSLNPDEDRLVICAELTFSTMGRRTAKKFYPAVIRSRARLTYRQVAACLSSPETCELENSLRSQLKQMEQLAAILNQARRQRGSLDLELPETGVVLDQNGIPCDLRKVDRTPAHRLIEEFMLAANEAVADFLQSRDQAFLYRIHEPPELQQLQELQQLAAACGVGLALGKNLHHQLQQFLHDCSSLPEARLLRQQLLRSLKQACYSPRNQGHFGLAADVYCHFTSPIRRYPDLTVHRILKQVLAEQPNSPADQSSRLLRLGQDCSTKERRAMQAERDLIELRRCQIMSRHLGEKLTGTISSVTEFGFFVELDDLFVEGLVHIRTLDGDYYHFDPRSVTLTGTRKRRQFSIGKRVRIRVKQVDPWTRRIDFELESLLRKSLDSDQDEKKPDDWHKLDLH